MDKARLVRAAIGFYKSVVAGIAGGFIVSIRNEQFSSFMVASFLLLAIGLASYYEILKVEEKYVRN